MNSRTADTVMCAADDPRQRGSALLIALFLTMGLALIAMSSAFRGTIEDTVSLHQMGATQALVSADAAIDLAIPWLSYDHRADPNGWSNEYLLVPAPPGTWPTGLLQDDDVGSVTSVADAFYFDLRDADGDGTADQQAPGLVPYDVPAGLPFAASDDGDLLACTPCGFTVSLRNRSDDTNPGGGAPVLFEANEIVVRIEGSSQSVAEHFGVEPRPSTGVVEVTLGHGILSIWENAMFSDASVGALPSNTTLHGSVHILGGTSPAISLVGDSQILNNYEGLDAELVAAAAPLVGVPVSLGAEVRVRTGSVEINSGSASVGEPDGSTAAKDSLDGAYIAGGAFAGSNSGNNWTDTVNAYDMNAFEFLNVMENGTYTDPLTSTAYSSYYDYLRGSTDGSGVSGLDLSFWGVHGGSNGNISLNRASALFNPDQSAAEQLERRYDLLVDNAFLYSEAGTQLDVYIEQTDGSWGQHTYTSAGGAPAATPGVDVTGVVGVVKEVPAGAPGSSNPFPDGYRHGFIWIPPDVTVDVAGAAIIDWMITQMNEYLDSPIPSPVDAGTGTILPSGDGRMFASGVVLVHRVFMNRGVIQDTKDAQSSAYLTDIRYAGAFSIISEHISEMAGDVLPLRTFPCEDVMGVASTEDVEFAVAGMLAAGAFYAEADIEIAAQVELLGGTIAGGEVNINGTGVHLAASPSLDQCLPPFLPDIHIASLKMRSWTTVE